MSYTAEHVPLVPSATLGRFPFVAHARANLYRSVCVQRLILLRGCQEKAAACAHQHQYGDIGRAAAGAGHRAGDSGEDFADAQVVRPVQERRRFARHSRHRSKAPRKNAQVSHGG